jgi:hypothetical protein
MVRLRRGDSDHSGPLPGRAPDRGRANRSLCFEANASERTSVRSDEDATASVRKRGPREAAFSPVLSGPTVQSLLTIS